LAEANILEANFSPLAACSFDWSNIILKIEKNISPSKKGLMGFISFGGAIFLFRGRLKPLQTHAWLRP